jgi:hypothetical protein
VSTPGIIGIVIVVIVIVVVAALAMRMRQRRALQSRFGDEYDRVVDEKGGRSAAEAELRRRERRHAELSLRELSDADKTRFREGWTAVQAQFIDDPVAAVHEGDRLVTELVTARGYPTAGYEDRLEHLSVEHASVLNSYREAHDISVRNDAGNATTEELRKALVDFRELVTDLLGESPVPETATVGNGVGVDPATPAVITAAAAQATPDTTVTDAARDREGGRHSAREDSAPAAARTDEPVRDARVPDTDATGDV